MSQGIHPQPTMLAINIDYRTCPTPLNQTVASSAQIDETLLSYARVRSLLAQRDRFELSLAVVVNVGVVFNYGGSAHLSKVYHQWNSG